MPGRKAPELERREQIMRAAFEVAARDGLEGLTVRKVAMGARLSTGLVLFHFRTKEQLVVALLDWVLATTTVLQITDDIASIAVPLDRFIALLQREMHRLSAEPRRMRVFFEFWVMGIRHRGVGARMRTELRRYREAFRPMAEEVLRAEPGRFAGVTPGGLAAVGVSFIKGCAVQSMIDADHFDIADYLAAAQALVGQLATRAPRGGRRGTARRARVPRAVP